MKSRLPTHPFMSLPGIPEEARGLVEQLLFEQQLPAAKLKSGVIVYRRLIQQSPIGDVHAQLGLDIADVLLRILARVDERTGAIDYSVIQAATLYFLLDNDGYGSDLEHEGGLFDDAHVCNAMLRWLGRDDLKLTLPRYQRPPNRSINVSASTKRPVAAA